MSPQTSLFGKQKEVGKHAICFALDLFFTQK
jgi:hypothetical protein